MIFRTIRTAIRTCSTPIVIMTVNGSTRTTTSRTRTGTTTTVSRSSSRKSLHFSFGFMPREFCFVIWPFQPPSILPISSILIDSELYFLSSSELFSHRIMSKIFTVSTFRIANFICVCFSSGVRKIAAATASIISTQRLSMRWPNVNRWIRGSPV